ncbi:hypothetical protein EAE96_004422 [Botrytis aclada]|nr:hypothetical protein EAE96_004422 [Botrytis aclada]
MDSKIERNLRKPLALKPAPKEFFLDQEVVEKIALWTRGCPPTTSTASPLLSKVINIMNSFTVEDALEIRQNNPKKFQSDFQEMLSLYVDSRDKHNLPDAYCGAVCLGLTCCHYWISFSRTWCYAGTNIIIYRPPRTSKMALALLLETWVGPEYRSFYSKSALYEVIPMFLSRELYGRRGSLAERQLPRRYEDHLILYTCRSTTSTAGLPFAHQSPHWRGVLSPFGLGKAWYIEAARQICAGLDCDTSGSLFTGDEPPCFNCSAWRYFRQSHHYDWACSEEDFPTSKFQENIKEWLKSYGKSFEQTQ